MRDGCVNYIWHFLLGLDMGELNFEKKKYICSQQCHLNNMGDWYQLCKYKYTHTLLCNKI